MKLVVDVSPLVSASLWDRPPSRLVSAALRGQAQMFLSLPMLLELAEVLNYPRLAERLHERKETAASITARFRYVCLQTVPAQISRGHPICAIQTTSMCWPAPPRRLARPAGETGAEGAERLLLEVAAADPYEYVLLVTNADGDLAGLAQLYREGADSENTIDELKRQWGWGGFVTQDLRRCPVAARTGALIYNWWSLCVRCADPERAREAVTRRPLLLGAVGRETKHAGRTTLVLTSVHAHASQAQRLLTDLSLFLSGLRNAAEQLSSQQCWERIGERILTPCRKREAACRAGFGQQAWVPG